MDGNKKKTLIIVFSAAVIVITAVVLVVVNMVKPKEEVKSTTMRLLQIIGEVKLEANGEIKTIVDNLRLADGNVLSTGDKSLASIGLDDYKIINLEENSRAEFHQDGKKLELNLTDGKLFFDVRKPLDETESMDIYASNMIVGIRGTSGYVVAVAKSNEQLLYITDGHVTIKVYDPVTKQTTDYQVGAGEVANIQKDEEGNIVGVSVDKFEEKDLPPELAAEIKSNPETYERIMEATGFDNEKIEELIENNPDVAYITLIDDSPEPTGEADVTPTPEPSQPSEVDVLVTPAGEVIPPDPDAVNPGENPENNNPTGNIVNPPPEKPSPVAPLSNDQDPATGTGNGSGTDPSDGGGNESTPTPTPTVTPTSTPTATPTQAPTPSPIPTAEPTPTAIPTPTTQPTPTPSPTPTAEPTPTAIPTPTPAPGTISVGSAGWTVSGLTYGDETFDSTFTLQSAPVDSVDMYMTTAEDGRNMVNTSFCVANYSEILTRLVQYYAALSYGTVSTQTLGEYNMSYADGKYSAETVDTGTLAQYSTSVENVNVEIYDRVGGDGIPIGGSERNDVCLEIGTEDDTTNVVTIENCTNEQLNLIMEDGCIRISSDKDMVLVFDDHTTAEIEHSPDFDESYIYAEDFAEWADGSTVQIQLRE